jgi:hypothetical protein
MQHDSELQHRDGDKLRDTLRAAHGIVVLVTKLGIRKRGALERRRAFLRTDLLWGGRRRVDNVG